jgi:hypothetical protein
VHARDTVFWPNITTDIDSMVEQCGECQEFQNHQKAEPPLPHEIPKHPWSKVGTDIFHLQGKHYVIIVDYTTKFFEFCQLPDITSPTVVLHTKRIFSKFGIPELVFSDNGPEFSAQDYLQFSRDWGFIHETSSPEFHQCNGLVERTIQTVKKTLLKCFKSGSDPYMAMLALRTTPLTAHNTSPATAMFGRDIRSNLPSLENDLHTPLPMTNQPYELPILERGQQVRIHDHKSWSRPGVIEEQRAEPRSYDVRLENGRTIRRNRRHILKTVPTASDTTQLDQEDTLNTPLQIPPSTADVETTTRSGRITRAPSYLGDYTA